MGGAPRSVISLRVSLIHNTHTAIITLLTINSFVCISCILTTRLEGVQRKME